MDACGQCADGFAYQYEFSAPNDTITSKVNYDTCVWAGSLMSNCFAVDGIQNLYGKNSNTVSRCIICKRGFNLSYDKKACVQESVNQCSAANYIKQEPNELMITGLDPFGTYTNSVNTAFKIRDLRYLTFYF